MSVRMTLRLLKHHFLIIFTQQIECSKHMSGENQCLFCRLKYHLISSLITFWKEFNKISIGYRTVSH